MIERYEVKWEVCWTGYAKTLIEAAIMADLTPDAPGFLPVLDSAYISKGGVYRITYASKRGWREMKIKRRLKKRNLWTKIKILFVRTQLWLIARMPRIRPAH